MPPKGSNPLVPLGVVIGAHGLQGELRVKPFNPSSELLLSLPSARVRLPQDRGEGRERALRRARRQGTGFVITLEGCDDRDAAEAMRGAELSVPRSALPPLEEGEHYLIDLVGLEARLPDGEVVGKVIEALEYPASHALRVTGPRGTLEVPLLEPYVVELRPDEGFVIVDQLEDLEPARGD